MSKLWYYICFTMFCDKLHSYNNGKLYVPQGDPGGGGGGGGGGGIGYQVSDITSTKCSFGYFSLDTPTPFAVLTVFLDNT